MTQPPPPALGSIAWADLTVPDAPALRDFYAAVAGWTPSPLQMNGYDDYVMMSPDGATAYAGVCHARGPNAGLPPVWLIYVAVADLDASLAECTARGGQVLVGPKQAGPQARFAVIRDPAGAALALHETRG